ncbi:MAG TPA: hypothetical protein VMI52_09595 [Acetobacteraceae bacterium]|nr:hypothetical protein [Acetobacteraceae bacterium]
MSIRGSVDSITVAGANGWAFSKAARQSLILEAVLHQRVIGEAIADIHRPDLASVGFGDGNCGFEIRFHTPIEPAYLPFVSIRPEGGDVELPRTELSGFKYFFKTLHENHASVGRQRSVFGGLWTDRTDAAAILRGRLAIGSIDAGYADLLRQYITDGYVVIENAWVKARPQAGFAGIPGGIAEMGAFSVEEAVRDRASDMLFNRRVLAVLQAIFDDTPVGVQATVLNASADNFKHPSAEVPLASPLECVSLVAPFDGQSALVEVVRNSHTFSDFTHDGRPRWSLSAEAVTDIAVGAGGTVDPVVIPEGAVAVLSPGLLYRYRDVAGGSGLELLATPARQAPVSLARQASPKEVQHASGARLWV